MVSVRTNIYSAMVTALGTITVANGYNVTLASAQKILYLATDSARPYVIASFKREDKTPATDDTYACSIRFQVFCYIDEVNEGDATSIEDAVDLLVSDVEKLLAVQRALSPPFGVTGCEDVILDGHEKYDVGGEWVQGATVFGTILYQHATEDPDAP